MSRWRAWSPSRGDDRTDDHCHEPRQAAGDDEAHHCDHPDHRGEREHRDEDGSREHGRQRDGCKQPRNGGQGGDERDPRGVMCLTRGRRQT